MSGPLFTVIMATYNRRDLLPRAINSVLSQTFGDFELLVIDNGSTDDTGSVVGKFKDPRVKYILNPRPTKSCDAPRNLGIDMARGSLVSFLDDDDLWYPERLGKVKEAFDKNPGACAVCHNENKTIDGKFVGLLRHGPWSEDIYERLLYDRNCLSSCAMTIKTGLLRELNGFDLRAEFDSAADYDLWLRMAAKSVKIFFIEEPLGEFSVTGRNWSKVNPEFESRVAFLVKEHIVKYERRGILRISKKGMRRLSMLYLIAARAFLRAGHYGKAAAYFFRAGLFFMIRPALITDLYKHLKDKRRLAKDESCPNKLTDPIRS